MRASILLMTIICIMFFSFASSHAQKTFSKEIGEELLPAFRVAIQSYSFQCPRAAVGYYKGVYPNGDKFKIFCGPTDGGVYPNLVYEVVLFPDMKSVFREEPGSGVHVNPWQD